MDDPIYPEAYSFFNNGYEYHERFGYVPKRWRHDESLASNNYTNPVKVVFVGDSVTEQGQFINPLHKLLVCPNSNIDLINLGVTGYNTQQELGIIKEFVTEIEPSLVVLQIHLNDFELAPVFLNLDGEWIGVYAPTWFNANLYMRSNIYKIVSNIFLYIFSQKENDVYIENNSNKMVLEPLKEIIQVLEKNKIPLLVITFPSFNPDHNMIQSTTIVNETVEAAGYSEKYLNLSYALSHFNAEAGTISFDYGHPNELGGYISAYELSKRLKTELKNYKNIHCL